MFINLDQSCLNRGSFILEMKVSDKPRGKAINGNGFFKSAPRDHVTKPTDRQTQGTSNRRIRRKELIAKKEKMNFRHKFEKQLRYERKQEKRKQQQTQGAGDQTQAPNTAVKKNEETPLPRGVKQDKRRQETDEDRKNKSAKNPAVNTVYRRAQAEYEKKQEEKRIRQEVS